jgi:hypothetical protein
LAGPNPAAMNPFAGSAASRFPVASPVALPGPAAAAPAVITPVIAGPVAATPAVATPAVPATAVAAPVVVTAVTPAPAVAASTVAAPVVVTPAVVMQAIAKPIVAMPVATTRPVAATPTAAIAPEASASTATGQPVPIQRSARDIITGRQGASSTAATVQPAPNTPQEVEDATTRQNPERKDPDPRDAKTLRLGENPQATDVSGHAVSPTANSQEVPASVQPHTPGADSIVPLVHNSAAAQVGSATSLPTPVPTPITLSQSKPEIQATSRPLPEESLIDQTKTQQPIRSLALEFAPDGAGDIKVRLSERGGDVHISLHGTDSLLAGRVREGVGDLVGSLSRAGYDAEAWTPDQGRQNQKQESDQRPAPRKTSGGADAEEFSGILQQPIQEIS